MLSPQLRRSRYRIVFVTIVIFYNKALGSTPVSNSNSSFNANIRKYSVIPDDVNTTNIKTLQKEEVGRYANFAPIHNPIRFKEIPDNAISSSSYSRGLLRGDHTGYGLHDYDDSSHYGHGYEYYLHDSDHHGHDHHHNHGHHHDHHDHHDDHHHEHHGHHHKHLAHALAAKTILWPIAGLALLGAAAFVTNPVLLQLGVVSGRRRRDTDRISNLNVETDNMLYQNLTPNSIINTIKRSSDVKYEKDADNGNGENILKRRILKKRIAQKFKQGIILNATPTTTDSYNQRITVNVQKKYDKDTENDRFVPIPLKYKNK